MNEKQNNIIDLINSVLNKKNANIKVIKDFSYIFDIATRHHIMTMLYYAFYYNDIRIEADAEQLLQYAVFRELSINEKQLHYINKLNEEFNKNNIDHMFLKGSVLKNLYPRTEIRRMGDIDILIKEKQYDKIAVIMKKEGFSFHNESNHEFVWLKENIRVELHKILMPSYNKDLHAYFGNGWKRAVKTVENCYTFSNDDMFIYIFSHFAKHYRDAGIGIMHMCDLYVFLKSYSPNLAYISAELKKLHLYDFYRNIRKTLDVWFNGSQGDEVTDYITAVIFDSGVYGLKEKSILSTALKSEKQYKKLSLGKLQRIFKRVFPGYNGMKTKYQTLKKLPVLLPAFWIWRWVMILITKHHDIKKELHNICAVSQDEVSEYQKSLKYVGLDYYF